jgi:hypothetical protein
MTSKPRKPSRPRPTRESFYVRVETGEGSVAFVNATEHIGKVMPFRKPRATCAMSVGAETVGFSLLHLSAKNAATMAAKPIQVPRGPLARLERRAASLGELTTEELVVELSTRVPTPQRPDAELAGDAIAVLDDLFADDAPADDDAPAAAGDTAGGAAGDHSGDTGSDPSSDGDPDAPRKRAPRPATIESWRYLLRRDANNVVSLEAVDEEHNFELPTWPLHVTLYLKSPATGHRLAVNFIGHIGKPGNVETIGRVASMVLNSISHLPEFRILGQVETVSVPAAPGRGTQTKRVKAEERAVVTTKVFLFDDQFTPVASGAVAVEFDLVNANPTTGRLLVTLTPEETLAPMFDRYRPLLEIAVGQVLRTELGDDEMAQMTYDIILGSVDTSMVERLREVGAKLGAIDLSPTQWKPHV